MSSPSTTQITRLAPSPTGALHLGNLRTFIINWILAQQNDWKVLLRIDDLDGPRIKKYAESDIFEVFQWVGLEWETPVSRQSDDLEPYHQAMERLCKTNHCYPCQLSRSEIAEAYSAPHGDRKEAYFPPSLRPDERPDFDERKSSNWRFAVPHQTIEFKDQFCGKSITKPAETVGDFVVWTKNGTPSYQLAVVIDDARQAVTQIVRGDDLLDSTGRQILLMQALNYKSFPTYTHLPLVLGPDGRRLAKRHGDTRVLSYREKGVTVPRLLGLMAFWCGTIKQLKEISLNRFVDEFQLKTLSREPIIMTKQDEEWLLSGV